MTRHQSSIRGLLLRDQTSEITLVCHIHGGKFAKTKFDQGGSFVFLRLVFLMLSRLFIAALWSPAGKGLGSCW